MHKLWLDKETFSEQDITEVGGYKYAEDETTEILLFAFAIDDDEPIVWDITTGEPPPIELIQALEDDTVECIAHNANFDRTILRMNRIGLPIPQLSRWRCTMAQALSHALPGKLSELCVVLKVPEDQTKLKEGKKLLDMFTQLQAKNRKLRRLTRETHPVEWKSFKVYAAQDIVSMRECARRMPTWNWNASAIAEWHCDQRINDRGFQVDTELTAAGARAAITEKISINTEFTAITGGIRPGQREKFKAWVQEHLHIYLDNTKRDTFEQYLKNPKLDPLTRRLMELSIAANKTSTAKYAALDIAVGADGRFRGGVQFAGAGRTRRWAGRLFQPQNLPSRALPPAAMVAEYIECLKAGTHDIFFGELMRYGAAALRGCVIVAPGKKMVAADLSNIEGRKLSWFAGEGWKLKAFRDYDTIDPSGALDKKGQPKRLGPDLYNITATSIIGGDPWNVAKQDRNVFGKVPDLACGYRGGVTGFQTFAHAYGVRMEDHWITIQKMIDSEHVERAQWGLKNWGKGEPERLEISHTEWLASETCKLAWRARHPATVKLWSDVENACMRAIRQWGSVQTINNKLKVGCVTHHGLRWMCIRLPSGRYLTYLNPTLRSQRYGDRVSWTIWYEGQATEKDGKASARFWSEISTHGGKMVGNICQTSARDVLAQALPEAEDAGYLTVLTVHDEAVTECDDKPEFNVEGLCAFLAKDREWTRGLPLSAAGFESYRYGKED